VTNVIARITDVPDLGDGIPQFAFEQEDELLDLILEQISSARE